MPYISIINTNASILIFCLGLAFSFNIANHEYVLLSEDPQPLWRMFIVGFIGVAWMYFITWVFMGDSVWWSELIRCWLNKEVS